MDAVYGARKWVIDWAFAELSWVDGSASILAAVIRPLATFFYNR